MTGAPGPAGPTGPQGPRGPGVSWVDSTGKIIPGFFGEQVGGGPMYVDSNGDFWSVLISKDTLSFGGFTNTQFFAYTSPDCSGPSYFMTEGGFGAPPPPYPHVVFLDRPEITGNLRVRNTDAKLRNIQVQSIQDTDGSPCRAALFESTVLAVADTTVVTPPNIAVSMPLHPVFTP